MLKTELCADKLNKYLQNYQYIFVFLSFAIEVSPKTLKVKKLVQFTDFLSCRCTVTSNPPNASFFLLFATYYL